ncbi:MAG: metal ABC transporter ATP-binding protein [Chloroflexi bacterium]|nr:metal ABC transporter ATP-binding protein [Chloroflexota bacterium]
MVQILKIDNLSVAYGRNLALKEVNLGLEAGQLVGIIGPNGAGKSTLLKAMLGIVAYRGQVLVGGQPLAKVRNRVSYVPQKEEVRWDFPVTVWDVVMMGRYRRIGWVKFAAKIDREVVGAALEEVGMSKLRDRQISQLSGGQQQRVFMARALAQEGDIILLDEPLTGVDVASQEVILKLLTHLSQQGKLVLMATHDLNVAAEKCDMLCCINRGLVAFGKPAAVFQPEVLTRTYGGKVLMVNHNYASADRLANSSLDGQNGSGLTTMIID